MDKMKKTLNLHCGNKGFIFSLDIFMAIIVITLSITASLLFIFRANDNNISLLQETKIADDITSVLDYNKKFDSLNKNTIISNINSVIPQNYNMSFRIECQNKIIQNIGQIPSTFVASSERVIVTDNLDFCIMRYWLWAK